jgi:hypothetical protein
MEGRVLLECGECRRTRQISGEIPEEYTRSFDAAVHEEGWAPRPGSDNALICGDCLMKFAGHETVDDQEKVRGLRDPMDV